MGSYNLFIINFLTTNPRGEYASHAVVRTYASRSSSRVVRLGHRLRLLVAQNQTGDNMKYTTSRTSASHLSRRWQKVHLQFSTRNPKRLLGTASTVAVAAIMVVLFSAVSLLQAQVAGTGTIAGVVLDPSGALV